VKVRWRFLLPSTSLGKRCTSYSSPPTSRKRTAGRWSLRNFLLRSSLFMVGKAYKSHGARPGLYGGCSNRVPPISVSASIATSAVCGLALSWRRNHLSRENPVFFPLSRFGNPSWQWRNIAHWQFAVKAPNAAELSLWRRIREWAWRYPRKCSTFTFISPSVNRFHHLRTAARLIASSP
jgi:hypothetical protein